MFVFLFCLLREKWKTVQGFVSYIGIKGLMLCCKFCSPKPSGKKAKPSTFAQLFVVRKLFHSIRTRTFENSVFAEMVCTNWKIQWMNDWINDEMNDEFNNRNFPFNNMNAASFFALLSRQTQRCRSVDCAICHSKNRHHHRQNSQIIWAKLRDDKIQATKRCQPRDENNFGFVHGFICYLAALDLGYIKWWKEVFLFGICR